MFRVTYQMRELGTGRPFRVSGTGPTLADARAEARARVAGTVGLIQKATNSGDEIAADLGTANAGPQFSDAILVLRRGNGTTVPFKFVTTRLENLTTAVSPANQDGTIDLEDPIITTIVATYFDTAGLSGYVAVRGEWVR